MPYGHDTHTHSRFSNLKYDEHFISDLLSLQYPLTGIAGSTYADCAAVLLGGVGTDSQPWRKFIDSCRISFLGLADNFAFAHRPPEPSRAFRGYFHPQIRKLP